MKVFTGKELMESFSAIDRSMATLQHMANGERPCKCCRGTGWRSPTRLDRIKRRIFK